MKPTKNVVIKKESHSRKSVSGIYNACCCQIKDNSLLNECVEDPRVLRTAKSGMTTNFNQVEALNKGSFRAPLRSGFTDRSVTPQCWYAGYSGHSGFTLIELLVVVLIIGILAAVAVPQYQKAVLKSKLTKYIPLADAIYQAQKVYFLENGEYAATFEDLGIDIPTPLSSCTHTITSGSKESYKCPNYNININKTGSYIATGLEDLMYRRQFDDYQGSSYTFLKDRAYCFAKGNNAIQACLALGGTDTGMPGDKYYDKRFLLP